MEDLTTTEDLTVTVETDDFATELTKRFLLGAATTIGGLAAGAAVGIVKTKLEERKARKAQDAEETPSE